nr:ankyrin repeat domain-containing protein [Aeoliella straminimaris]
MVRAAERGDTFMFAALIALGAQVDRGFGTGGYDTTPLMDAAYDGDLRAIELYLQHGAYVDYQEKDCFTAINYAAMEGHWDIVLRLHAAGADPHHRDATGSTAVDYAKEQGRYDIAEELKKRSAREARPEGERSTRE